MNKFRKLIALLLTVIMFVGVLPMNALAAVIVATDTSESKQISVRAIKPDPENFTTRLSFSILAITR